MHNSLYINLPHLSRAIIHQKCAFAHFYLDFSTFLLRRIYSNASMVVSRSKRYHDLHSSAEKCISDSCTSSKGGF